MALDKVVNDKINVLATPTRMDVPIRDTGLIMIDEFSKIIESANNSFAKQNYPARINFSFSEVIKESKRYIIGELNIIREGDVIKLLQFNQEIDVKAALSGNYYYNFAFSLYHSLVVKGINFMELELAQANQLKEVNVDLKALDTIGLMAYITLMAEKYGAIPLSECTVSDDPITNKRNLFEFAIQSKVHILHGKTN